MVVLPWHRSSSIIRRAVVTACCWKPAESSGEGIQPRYVGLLQEGSKASRSRFQSTGLWTLHFWEMVPCGFAFAVNDCRSPGAEPKFIFKYLLSLCANCGLNSQGSGSHCSRLSSASLTLLLFVCPPWKEHWVRPSGSVCWSSHPMVPVPKLLKLLATAGTFQAV